MIKKVRPDIPGLPAPGTKYVVVKRFNVVRDDATGRRHATVTPGPGGTLAGYAEAEVVFAADATLAPHARKAIEGNLDKAKRVREIEAAVAEIEAAVAETGNKDAVDPSFHEGVQEAARTMTLVPVIQHADGTYSYAFETPKAFIDQDTCEFLQGHEPCEVRSWTSLVAEGLAKGDLTVNPAEALGLREPGEIPAAVAESMAKVAEYKWSSALQGACASCGRRHEDGGHTR